LPLEAQTRLHAAEAKLTQLTRQISDASDAVTKAEAERIRLQAEYDHETDANKREIVRTAINAQHIAAALHYQQKTALSDNIAQLRKDIEALKWCLANAH